MHELRVGSRSLSCKITEDWCAWWKVTAKQKKQQATHLRKSLNTSLGHGRGSGTPSKCCFWLVAQVIDYLSLSTTSDIRLGPILWSGGRNNSALAHFVYLTSNSASVYCKRLVCKLCLHRLKTFPWMIGGQLSLKEPVVKSKARPRWFSKGS